MVSWQALGSCLHAAIRNNFDYTSAQVSVITDILKFLACSLFQPSQ
jgi:hypothetical protein